MASMLSVIVPIRRAAIERQHADGDGTNRNDVITVQKVTPDDGSECLYVIRNGVIYPFDPVDVIAITLNGFSGDDTLSIGPNAIVSSTLNGGGGNDRLIGGRQ